MSNIKNNLEFRIKEYTNNKIDTFGYIQITNFTNEPIMFCDNLEKNTDNEHYYNAKYIDVEIQSEKDLVNLIDTITDYLKQKNILNEINIITSELII